MCDVDLMATARRIKAAGKRGKGVRLTAQETHALLTHNLPCTGEDPSVGDDFDEPNRIVFSEPNEASRYEGGGLR